MNVLNIQSHEYGKVQTNLKTMHSEQLKSIQNAQKIFAELTANRFYLECSSVKLTNLLTILNEIIPSLQYVFQQSEECMDNFLKDLIRADQA